MRMLPPRRPRWERQLRWAGWCSPALANAVAAQAPSPWSVAAPHRPRLALHRLSARVAARVALMLHDLDASSPLADPFQALSSAFDGGLEGGTCEAVTPDTQIQMGRGRSGASCTLLFALLLGGAYPGFVGGGGGRTLTCTQVVVAYEALVASQ